jgi:hypothetical protein
VVRRPECRVADHAGQELPHGRTFLHTEYPSSG